MRLPLLLVSLFALACAPYHADKSGEELLAGVTHDDGDGVDGDADQCPRAREDVDGFQDDDGCPDADNDGDGWTDAADACPDEDGGPRSTDGCVPFIDDDGDGVEDSGDKCPKRAEVMNGYRDADGCPDVAVLIEGDALRFGESVTLFEPGAIDLAAGADLALSEIAWQLTQHPELAKVEIGAHVEAVGRLAPEAAGHAPAEQAGRGQQRGRLAGALRG